MPAPVLHVGATVLCSHIGQATPLLPFPRVTVSGQAVVTVLSPYSVSGCILGLTSTPPCVLGLWSAGATRVLAGGMPVLTMAGSSTCIPTGNPLLPLVAQTRVLAT